VSLFFSAHAVQSPVQSAWMQKVSLSVRTKQPRQVWRPIKVFLCRVSIANFSSRESFAYRSFRMAIASSFIFISFFRCSIFAGLMRLKVVSRERETFSRICVHRAPLMVSTGSHDHEPYRCTQIQGTRWDVFGASCADGTRPRRTSPSRSAAVS